MYKNLLEDAKKDKIKDFEVVLIVKNKDQILLLENPINKTYEMPYKKLNKDESIQQAIQRAAIETLSINLNEIITYLGHFDKKEKDITTREFYFIVTVEDPSLIQLKEHSGYSFLTPEDAAGYPISDHLRETIDLYLKY